MQFRFDTTRQFFAVTHDDDIASVEQGSAIPHGYSLRRRALSIRSLWYAPEPLALVALLGCALVFFAAQQVTFPAISSAASTITAPTIVVEHSSTGERTELAYGTEPLLAQPDFFSQISATLRSDQATFIEADLSAMELRYYEDGQEVYAFPIVAKGKSGSWWETPAGLYQVQAKRERHYSSFANVNLPWSMPFQGNFFIHGIPEYSDGTRVDSSFSGGCIRLETSDAQRLFERAAVGTPILVHEPRAVSSAFMYEPNIPDIATPHYLLADVESGTILASSDLNQAAPIASITKLMTALIAVEYINLDARVTVHDANFIQSMVPRLADRRSVSMYSLLQLLLMESSNEAAETIAAQLGKETFVARMNEKAAAIGLYDTHFADPSGLSSENTSTLADLLRLAQYIHLNRSFILQLTADQYLPTAYVGDEFGELNNFNRLADLDDFYGGKVGETNAAGQTSLTLHRFMVRGEERIIAIAILGSTERTKDVLQLHEYFRDRFVR